MGKGGGKKGRGNLEGEVKERGRGEDEELALVISAPEGSNSIASLSMINSGSTREFTYVSLCVMQVSYPLLCFQLSVQLVLFLNYFLKCRH